MLNFFTTLESALRIDTTTSKSELMRARAVYLIGLAFIATQVINLTLMSYSYGRLSFDHLVSGVVCVFVTITILLLRRSRKFQIYAASYSVLIIAGTMSSALNQNTGINSALLPFFVLGIIVNGFICGWRATVTFGTIAIISIWFLWWISSNYSYTPIFDVDKFTDRNFQRAVQTSLAIILITIVGGFFSKSMHDAFGELESGILAAQESDRAKTDFLATMSHELFTPMNGIIGMNEVLEETDLDEDQRELTGIIRQSGHDLQMIISNVLLFSQLEAERVQLDDTPFSIRETVNDIVAPYAVLAESKGLVFNTRIAPSVVDQVVGDSGRVTQIICALLNNAVKFTDQGAVELSVQTEGNAPDPNTLIFTVTDTGIGIPSADQERIFERFMQRDGSIKRRHGGTGLGLTVARGLTELMDGDLNVLSEVGEGSSFSARLRVSPAQPEIELLQAAE